MQQDGQQGAVPEPGQVEAPPAATRRRGYRSLFWAMILLGAGVVALLFNLEVIGAASLGMLTYVWPLVLIGAAVDLVVARRSAVVGALVGLVTVGVMVALMLVGSAAGWAGDDELKTETFTEPIGGATRAEVSIGTGGYSARIDSQVGAEGPPSSEAARPLIEATVTYRGSVAFDVSGEERKVISLSATGQRFWWQWLAQREADTWHVGLGAGVPLDLSVSSSSGSAQLDLTDLELAGLRATMSSGQMTVNLPQGAEAAYKAALSISSGDLEVEAPAGAQVDMSVDMSSGDARVALGAECEGTVSFNGSSGQFTLYVASGQAVRLEVRSVSSGDVDVPKGMVRISGGDGEEGVWETPGYAGAARKVVVVIKHMSSGSVDLRVAD